MYFYGAFRVPIDRSKPAIEVRENGRNKPHGESPRRDNTPASDLQICNCVSLRDKRSHKIGAFCMMPQEAW